MVYKFKSRATGDLLVLERDAKRILEIIGKDDEPTGIILTDQMAAAQHALTEAFEREEVRQFAAAAQAKARGQTAPCFDEVPLKNRVLPFIDMLERSARDGGDIVWGA